MYQEYILINMINEYEIMGTYAVVDKIPFFVYIFLHMRIANMTLSIFR